MFDAAITSNHTEAATALIRPARPAGHAADRDLQRANGSGRITLCGSHRGTRIADIFQRSPLRILLPVCSERSWKEVVFLNTSGGIAGGDRLEVSVTAQTDAAVAVTSQAAEKVYRALSEPAQIATTLTACAKARLAWLPQETIVFDRARLRRRTEIELSTGSELLALEWLVLGRAARAERIMAGEITDSWRVTVNGRLTWADSFRVTNETIPRLRSKALLSNSNAIGTLIYFGPQLEVRLDGLREVVQSLACHCAATLVGELVVVRLAAEESADLRAALRRLLQRFSEWPDAGPFRTPKMWSC